MLWENVLVVGLIGTFLLLIAFKVENHASDGSVGPQRFEATSHHDRPGFWGPATASIDWCERNYVVSYYIAEFFNTASNVLLLISGSHCIWQTLRHQWDLRFAVAGIAILTIGLGSIAYHSTLQYWAQLWDEVPMVWAELVFTYINLRVSRQGHSNLLAGGLAAYGVAWTVVHSLGAYVVLFQLHFGLIVLANLYLMCGILRTQCHVPILPFGPNEPLHPARHGLRWMVWFVVFYTSFAFILWVIDQVACDTLHRLPGGIPNPQLHAWWHLILGLSSHFLLQSAIVMRHTAVLGTLPSLQWVLGGVLAFASPPKRTPAAEQLQ